MTAHNSRNASNSRNVSNNRTANPVWTQSKAEMLAKTVKLVTAGTEANSSRDDRNIQCCRSGSGIQCLYDPLDSGSGIVFFRIQDPKLIFFRA